MTRRLLLLLAATLLAAVGTALVYAYVRGVQARAQAGEASVTILVATSDVPAGAVPGVVADNSTPTPFPSRLAAPGSVSSIRAIPAGEVLTFPLQTGQQVTTREFGEHQAAGIPKGTVEVSEQIAYPQHVGATLKAGEHVDVYSVQQARSTGLIVGHALVALVEPDKNVVTFQVAEVDAVKIINGAQGQLVLVLLPS